VCNSTRLTTSSVSRSRPRTDHELTAEDAGVIERNVAGFFAVLREWSRAEQEQDEPPGTSVSSINSTDQEINK
jgi:hypothetical protein